jgi:hypothetical protein
LRRSIQAAITAAKKGDVTAIRLCMDRIDPPRRDSLRLPKIEGPADILPAMSAVAEAVSNSELTLDEAEKFTKMIEAFGRAIELSVFDARLRALEEPQLRRDQLDSAVMSVVRRQRGSSPASSLAYNLGNFLRTLAMPEPIKDWSLTTLKDKLIKIGASRQPRPLARYGRVRNRRPFVPMPRSPHPRPTNPHP